METSKVIQPTLMLPQKAGVVFSAEETKRLADFFAVLMEIDRRTNITKTYAKPIK
jgi:hypothetical protein